MLGVVEALRELIGVPLPPVDHKDNERLVTAVRALLDPADFEAVWAEGRAMTTEDAVACALNETNDQSAISSQLFPVC